jgi:hypothetical protein
VWGKNHLVLVVPDRCNNLVYGRGSKRRLLANASTATARASVGTFCSAKKIFKCANVEKQIQCLALPGRLSAEAEKVGCAISTSWFAGMLPYECVLFIA